MKIHLIGIGGIGVSALAQYYLANGHEVSGSDLVASEITDLAKQKGAKVIIGQAAENVPDNADLVVYSPAVKSDNPEFSKAKELGIKLQSYPEALGEISKSHFTIAVAGAHGKSTTTAMIGLVLAGAGLDPMVVVGTKVKEFGDSNFRNGGGKVLVIEACEYDSSFLNYYPKIIVITNVDKEHLDYFKTFANIKKAFKDFVSRLPDDGCLVVNKDDANAARIADKKHKTIFYSVRQKEAKKLKKILKVPGTHNVSNALAALAVARFMQADENLAMKALANFNGTWRRFEIKKGRAANKHITVVSDYGHHPNEIAATLKAAREKFGKKKIWCVFQPHQHQRTYYLFNDFVKTFRQAKADRVILADIYDVAGRETEGISQKVSSEKLAKKIGKKSVIYLPTEKIETYVKDNIRAGDVLIIMGAGDIYNLAEKF